MPEQFTDTISDTLGLGLAIGDAYSAPAGFPTFRGYIPFTSNSTSALQITDLTLQTSGTSAVGGSITSGDRLIVLLGFSVFNTSMAFAIGYNNTTPVSTTLIESWASSGHEGGVFILKAAVTTVPTSIYVGPNISGTISPIAGGTNLNFESMCGAILVFGADVAISGTPTNLTATAGALPPNQSITGSTASQMAFVVGGGGLQSALTFSAGAGTDTITGSFNNNGYVSTLAATFSLTPVTLSPTFSGSVGFSGQASGSTSFILAPVGASVTYDLYDQATDQITATDTSSYGYRPSGLAADTFSLSDVTAEALQLGAILADTILWSEITGTGGQSSALAEDTLSMTETAATADRWYLTTSDGLTLARSLALASRYSAAVTDATTLTERLRTALTVFAADTMTTSEDTLFKLGGLIVRERVRVADQLIPNTILQMLIAEVLRVADRMQAGLPVTALEQVSVGYALQVFRAIAVIDQLGLTESVLARAKIKLTAAEQVNFYDALRRFFAADAADQMNIADAMATLRKAVSVAADALTIADSLTPKMLLRVTTADALNLTDAQALRMIFRPDLEDGVEIAGAYVAPDGNLTTWAVNTRNGATTEYTGYNFNSFTRMGMRYIGSSSTGLYALEGDDDQGADIIAAMKGGFLQFNGSRFAGMKAVYLGIRGGGEFFLKLEAGTGETYTYKVIAENMETSKVWIGKGLRHRYLSYELISTGQDFDLESIEFVPMLAQRRV